MCPPKMKGHGEDKDLRSVGCHLKEETVSRFNTGLESQYWKSADQWGDFSNRT